ncbi:uncharacterized protein EKO05_0009489 [Ascochyta rabiei]|uniref:Uncharacterized protein n=1 Tax=Didymella rabiei TaxID=5454 RepID=A0A163GSJ6_DIDRA|nr:uncharacterized protein EKO05_0009489 [Ascochyta rabiei]KZM24992.1 hypothetical protein ST47_g3843 [Ascochyta rabiei]UPX19220.1 hypothetical protein EKO05_0009489 [Ascochyta rabiei]
MHNPVAATQGYPSPRPQGFDDPVYAAPPPEEPPPSYDEAIHSSTSPLLVGPPPDYGAFRAYVDPDESSEASSEIEGTDQPLHEWLGQAFGILVFLGIMYAFWWTINQPDMERSPG